MENFLDDFERDGRGQQNKSYLSVEIIRTFTSSDDKLAREFLSVYEDEAKGRYEFLRTLSPKKDGSKSWDIVRNERLAKIEKDIQANKSKLFKDDGSPTGDHLKLIHWAYSPSADKLKAYAANGGGSESRKRKSSDKNATGSSEAKRKSTK